MARYPISIKTPARNSHKPKIPVRKGLCGKVIDVFRAGSWG
jgi:hypothetical protein